MKDKTCVGVKVTVWHVVCHVNVPFLITQQDKIVQGNRKTIRHLWSETEKSRFQSVCFHEDPEGMFVSADGSFPAGPPWTHSALWEFVVWGWIYLEQGQSGQIDVFALGAAQFITLLKDTSTVEPCTDKLCSNQQKCARLSGNVRMHIKGVRSV